MVPARPQSLERASNTAPIPPESPRRLIRQREGDSTAAPPRRSVPGGQRGCLGTCALYGGLSCLVIVIVVSFLFLIAAVETFSFLRDPFDNALALFGFESDAEPEVTDTRVIVLGIRDMAFLQTASGNVQIVKSVVDSGAAPDARLRMSYIGTATVGIDLAQITDGDVVLNPDGGVTIYLPPVQISDCALREPEVQRSSCTEIPFVQDCDDIIRDMQTEAYERSLDELGTLAQDNAITTPNGVGILTVGYENAEKALFELIQQLGYDDVTFIRSEEHPPLSPTCLNREAKQQLEAEATQQAATPVNEG